ncbi:hypothetical protein [Roseibaca sp. Y0-43]|uniref:hypothetical protein n=1 Tax=Roseibaca sp. Y0-43 TaxID=2816854 RepID=UPI001D0C9C89|nr:hypothetical protein [Roseibaca sp. Y0-43]MCC1480298.1 hypothetical protein [Roseibaca sp. Y0-43]
MIPKLEEALATLAKDRCTTTYGALAAQLGLIGPGRIARLTSALEGLMEQDSAKGQALRAALVTGRASNGLPARGFFDKARALGHDVDDPAAFHHRQIAALFDSTS